MTKPSQALKRLVVLVLPVCVLALLINYFINAPEHRTQNKAKNNIAWQYDPSLQPITLEELQDLIHAENNTPATHNIILSRAQISHLAEYAVVEYDKIRQQYPDDAVLQSAYYLAVLSVNQPTYETGNAQLREEQSTDDVKRYAGHNAIEIVTQNGAGISYCWAVAGAVCVASAALPPHFQEYPKGLEYLERAIKLDPKYASALTSLAWAYVKRDDYANPQRALELAKKASDMNPKSAKAWYTQGLALRQLKREKEAKVFFKKAQALTPYKIYY